MSEHLSSNPIIQNTRHIYDLVDACVHFGVEHAVLCPGSRCAPLLIGFGRHPDINSISITDERSAAFVGLGLSQQSNKPVVLVCTSGTAAQNFAPAVTEAFYQSVPLIILTADRPAQWIDQWDGQTIHQQGLYGPHVKASIDFVAGDESFNEARKILQQAVTSATGPVHINIPISKPFYPQTLDDIPAIKSFSNDALKVTSDTSFERAKLSTCKAELESSKSILILAGQHAPDEPLKQLLLQTGVNVIGDITSNIKADSTDIIFNTDDATLCPDLLISFGRSVISEKQKQYFRTFKPKAHWHIGEGMVGNPFQTLSDTVPIEAKIFFQQWIDEAWKIPAQTAYQQHVSERCKAASTYVQSCLSTVHFNQFSAVASVLACLPQNSIVHLSNSMPVRIANFIGLSKNNINIWSNRGTSGIDGCVSTAVGHALACPQKIQTLIIGDLAFFYDRNGLWLNQELPKNLIIVLINNAGGSIFKMIPGPLNIEPLADLFIAPHSRNAELTAKEFGLSYHVVTSYQALDSVLAKVFNETSSIVEIFTNSETDQPTFQQLMKRV